MSNFNKISRWYFNKIPSIKSKEFIRFLTRAHELGRQFNKTVSGYVITDDVLPRTVKTTINIPEWVLAIENIPHLTEKEKSEAITACWNYAVMSGAILKTQTADVSNRRVLGNQDNITYSDYVAHLHASQRIKDSYPVFCEIFFDCFVNSFSNNDVYSMIKAYLNPKLRDRIKKYLSNEITTILDKITTTKNKDERRQLGFDLMRLLEEEQNKQDNQTESEQDQTESEQDQTESEQDQTESEQPSEGGNDSEDSGDGESEHRSIAEEAKTTGESRRKMQRIAAEMSETAENERDRHWGIGGYTEKESVTEYDIMAPGNWRHTYPRDSAPKTITASTDFKKFGTYLRRIKQRSEPPTAPSRVGNDLLENELYRIKTDRRVLGAYEPRKQPQKLEIILCCDISGSTEYYGPLWKKELEAAKGFYEALIGIGHTVHVYCHTTSAGPILLKITGYGGGSIDDRFNEVCKVRKAGNVDYTIIEYIGGKFTTPHKKVLFMLSDGEPCSGVGGVGDPYKATRIAAENLRNKGITVFSVSLVHSVNKSNDDIYGAEWNIDASRDIEKALQEIALKLTMDV